MVFGFIFSIISLFLIFTSDYKIFHILNLIIGIMDFIIGIDADSNLQKEKEIEKLKSENDKLKSENNKFETDYKKEKEQYEELINTIKEQFKEFKNNVKYIENEFDETKNKLVNKQK